MDLSDQAFDERGFESLNFRGIHVLVANGNKAFRVPRRLLHLRHLVNRGCRWLFQQDIAPGIQRGQCHRSMVVDPCRDHAEVKTVSMRRKHIPVVRKNLATSHSEFLALLRFHLRIDHGGGS